MLKRLLVLLVLLSITLGTFAGIPTRASHEEAPTSQDEQTLNIAPAQAPTPSQSINFRLLGTYNGSTQSPSIVPEIAAYDPNTQRLFAVGPPGLLDIIDLSNPANPTRVGTPITITGGPNSVAVRPAGSAQDVLVAVAVAATNEQENGRVFFFDTNGAPASTPSVEVGALPDMLTFTADGSKVLVANEGEPDNTYTTDPEGSISVIDVATFTVQQVNFQAFNTGGGGTLVNPQWVRVSGPNATPAQDFEPEYITIEGNTAYAILQENNSLAVIDITSPTTATAQSVIGLETKDHSATANPLDASNRDNMINIQNWPVRGMYMPDAIASYSVNGTPYIVTANEGDGRDYSANNITAYLDEARVGALLLDPTTFTNAATLQQDANLGRLTVTRAYKTLGMPAQVRAVHGSIDAGPVDVYVNDQPLVIPGVGPAVNIPFRTITPYLPLPAGTYNIKIVPTGQPIGSAVIDTNVTVQGGRDYTVAAIGQASLPVTDTRSLTAAVFNDNLTPPESGKANVRVYHFSTNTVPVDVIVNTGTMTPPVLIDNLAYGNANVYPTNFVQPFTAGSEPYDKEARNYLTVDAGNYNLGVTPSTDNSTVVLSPSLTLAQGNVYSIFAFDDPMAPNVTVQPEATPSVVSQIYSYGARSFSIWNGNTGALVYDSGDDFAQIVAKRFPAFFNANYSFGDNGFAFDERSDDKGGEPEGIDVGQVGNNTYAFIGLERQNGIMVYDITNPQAPVFVNYIVNTNFAGGLDTTANKGSAGNVSPEGVKFVSATDSPTGNPLLIVTHELSGTITIYEIETPTVYAPFVATSPDVLTLLHNNDGESTILPLTNSVAPGTGYPNTESVNLQVSGVAAFKTVMDREIADARTRGNSVLSVYAGDAFLASATLQLSLQSDTAPVYDAIAQRQMPYDAHIIGNHELDYNPDFLERFIRTFDSGSGLTQPFLGANLDFSGEPNYANLVTTDPNGIIIEPVSNGRVVGRALIVTDAVTGERYGIIGMSPPGLRNLSSPRNIQVTATELPQVATQVNTLVQQLESQGVNRIILVSHLQGLSEDQQLAPLLSGVDVMVAGGGDNLLTNKSIPDTTQLLPGETAEAEGDYPVVVNDADGEPVYIVTTVGNYKYVGRIDIEFGSNGEVFGINSETSYARRVIPNSSDNAASISALGVTDVVTPDANIVSSVVDPVSQGLQGLSAPIISTEVVLNTARGSTTVPGQRSAETNTGNLVTDAFIWNYDQSATAGGQPARSTSNYVIAIQNGGGIRQNAGDQLPNDGVVPGSISRQNTLDVLAFFNTMSVIRNISPTELKTIFERSVSRIGGGQFLQVAGVKIEADLSRTAQVVDTNTGAITTPGDRVRRVVLVDDNGNETVTIIENGAVVAGAPNVSIVTNSFTAGGGDNYLVFANKPATDVVQLLTPNNQILTYEDAWVRYMLSLPATQNNLPTIPNISKYSNTVNERVLFVTTP